MASAIEEDQPVTGPHPIDTSIVDPLGFRRWMVPLRYQLPRLPFGLEDGGTRWLEFTARAISEHDQIPRFWSKLPLFSSNLVKNLTKFKQHFFEFSPFFHPQN